MLSFAVCVFAAGAGVGQVAAVVAAVLILAVGTSLLFVDGDGGGQQESEPRVWRA
ncbi:hypothetical protein ACFC1R_33940 [Kitasatospora sp. NPDC056138]|uniref:hypothetical protein n=1 Tax=Kitasatospora sp. NPDC056138 TaxID=3345724 RepID=UPI0035DBA70D